MLHELSGPQAHAVATGPQDDISDTVMSFGTRSPDVSRNVVCAERSLIPHASTAGIKVSALECQPPVSGVSQVGLPDGGWPSFDDAAASCSGWFEPDDAGSHASDGKRHLLRELPVVDC